MGTGPSKVERALGPKFPTNEKYFGFQNFGNTCYANSVLQALYFCLPFRQAVLATGAASRGSDLGGSVPVRGDGAGSVSAGGRGLPSGCLLASLYDLFCEIQDHRDRSGVLAPARLLSAVRSGNEAFRGTMHQDAHEFLNYLLNDINDSLTREQSGGASASGRRSFVQDVFGGVLTNETKCLCCENVSRRDEPFLDLSVDVEQHTSISACLQRFSAVERLTGTDKFFCDTCGCLQEAEKCMKVKRAPPVLILHLKRFKYMEELERHKKLCYRVVFPFALRLRNMSSAAVDAEREYSLAAIVIHVGSGSTVGHYVAIVKSHGQWLLFDDETVEVLSESYIQRCFGSGTASGATDTGYILLYELASVAAAPADSIGPAGAGSGAALSAGAGTPPGKRVCT